MTSSDPIKLDHCGLVTPYGDKDLSQHWSRNGLSSVSSSDIYLRAILYTLPDKKLLPQGFVLGPMCFQHLPLWFDIRCKWCPGPRFNIKMSSYQYRKSHCGDKTVVRSSYLHNGISYTGKMSSLYWIRALAVVSFRYEYFENKKLQNNCFDENHTQPNFSKFQAYASNQY